MPVRPTHARSLREDVLLEPLGVDPLHFVDRLDRGESLDWPKRRPYRVGMGGLLFAGESSTLYRGPGVQPLRPRCKRGHKLPDTFDDLILRGVGRGTADDNEPGHESTFLSALGSCLAPSDGTCVPSAHRWCSNSAGCYCQRPRCVGQTCGRARSPRPRSPEPHSIAADCHPMRWRMRVLKRWMMRPHDNVAYFIRLITRRSQVQILAPLPEKHRRP